MQLETPRLILRPVESGDHADLCAIFGDPETMAFFPEPFSPVRVEEIIRKNLETFAAHGYGTFVAIEKESGRIIGECGITIQNIDDADEFEIGFCFAKEKWGRGFAPEAAAAMRDYGFEQLCLEKLSSYMASDHLQSRRVAEKIGMLLEKEYRNPNNRNFPTTVYSTLRSEIHQSNLRKETQ